MWTALKNPFCSAGEKKIMQASLCLNYLLLNLLPLLHPCVLYKRSLCPKGVEAKDGEHSTPLWLCWHTPKCLSRPYDGRVPLLTVTTGDDSPHNYLITWPDLRGFTISLFMMIQPLYQILCVVMHSFSVCNKYKTSSPHPPPNYNFD